jgi:alanine racemase
LTSRARLTVDLDALAANFAQIRADAPGAEVAPVVKADGYGLGAGPVGRRLWAEGARTFFVARVSEGEALRRDLGDSEAAILVLDGLLAGDTERLTAASLTPVLSGLDQVDAWAAAGGSDVVLHFDTGMNRLGIPHEAAGEVARRLTAAGLRPGLVMSHLSAAAEPEDPRNALQRSRFEAAASAFPGARLSLVASAGVYLDPSYRYDVVRPGICLYGGGPREITDPRFCAVATLTAPVLQVNAIEAGETVGYGSMFKAPRPMRIAMVGAGYADGVLRGSFRAAFACLRGRRAPYVVVTMDMIGLDVTAIPDVEAGDQAELLGASAPLDDLATASDDTVPHECLVRLSHRAERTYLGGA